MLFSFSEYAHISKALQSFPFLQPGQFSITRYDNQELHAAVPDNCGKTSGRFR